VAGTCSRSVRFFRGALLLAAVFLVALRPAHAATVTVDFESFAAMANNTGISPVPFEARLSRQLLSTLGVRFDSGSGYVAVVNLGSDHATSGTRGFGGTTGATALTYDRHWPIRIEFFDPANTTLPAVTDFVSVRADLLGAGGDLTMIGYGLQGEVLAAVSVQDGAGPTLQLSRAGIHAVEILGNGSAGFDDLKFNVPTSRNPEPRFRIDFDSLPGLFHDSPGQAIPSASRLSTQFLSSHGVRFSGGVDFLAVVDHGFHTTSGTNGIGGTSSGGLLTYARAFPMRATFFDPANPSVPATTDFVSIRSDTLPTGTTELTLRAYGLAGQLLESVSAADTGGAKLEISRTGIHSVEILGNGSVSFDDLEFNAPTQLPRPTNLQAVAIAVNRIDLAWTDNSATENGFEIERLDSMGVFQPIGVVGANLTFFQDTGLAPGAAFTYRVRAVNNLGVSAYSDEAVGVTTPFVPAAPSALSAAALSQSQIELRWTDNSSNETGFRIERRTPDGWEEVSITAPNVKVFTDKALPPGIEQSYRVIAFNLGGDSAPSNEAAASTLPLLPAAPSQLLAAAVSQTRIDLAWQDNAVTESGFRIERRQGTGAFSEIGVVGPNITFYSDTSVASSLAYSYRVRAHNASGTSGYSNEFAVSTPAPLGGKLSVGRSVDFGRARVGVPRSRELLIRNLNSTQPLSVTVSAAGPPFSVAGGAQALTIPPGGWESVTLRFTPTRRGKASGKVFVTSSDPSAPSVEVSVKGNGR